MKLLASDLDGTLLVKGEKQLNSRIKSVLRKFSGLGADFCIASGRTYGELLRLFEGLEKDTYFIAFDGALVIKNGESLYGTPFSKEDREFINKFDEFVLHGKYMTYVKSKYPYFIRKLKEQYNGHVVEISDISEVKDCIFKFVLYKNHRLLDEMPFDMVYKDNSLCEFVKKGTNKGEAFKWLVNDLGLDPDDTAVFGDSDNDIEFLKASKNSFAVKNSNHTIRKLCKFYTDDIAETIDLMLKEAAK